jgi:hypothetical protein
MLKSFNQLCKFLMPGSAYLFIVLLSFALANLSNGQSAIHTTHESRDTSVCKPVEFNLRPLNYPVNTPDTIITCTYDDITLYSGYTGNQDLQHRWSDGSTNPELPLYTSGVGTDVQTIWLELTDPLTGCLYSDTLVVVFDYGSCVGVDESKSEWPVRVFPNPTHDVLFIEHSDLRGPVQLFIFNHSGQVVYEESFNNGHTTVVDQFQINLDFLPTGLYLLKLISSQTHHTEKILID